MAAGRRLVHNGGMRRATRLRAGLSALLASAMTAHVLVTCGLWALLAAAPPVCCPSHDETPGASVSATCCAASEFDAQGPVAPAGTMPATHPMPAAILPSPAQVVVGYVTTLPVATRGHTVARLSALLI